MNTYKGPVCRGSWSLGNNCKVCERCIATKPTAMTDRTKALDELIAGDADLYDVVVTQADPWAILRNWLFRECTAGTRRHLWAMFGLPIDEVRNHGHEEHCFRYVRKQLQTASARITGDKDRRESQSSAPTEPQWQPIETAPKDETEILIYAHGMAIQARFYPGEWSHSIDGDEWDGPVWFAFDDAISFEVEDCGKDGMHHGPVTHWMPLPAPPA